MGVSINSKRKSDKLEAVNIRLTEKMKFTLDLAARIKETSQSAYVVDCLLKNFRSESSGLMTTPAKGNVPKFIPDLVWHELEYRRVTNLGIHAPEILNRAERLKWTVIEEDKNYWRDNGSPDFKKIRENWVSIQAKAVALLKEEQDSA